MYSLRPRGWTKYLWLFEFRWICDQSRRVALTLAGADSVNMSFPLFNMIQAYVVFLRDIIRDL